MKLQKKLDALKKDFESKAPADVIDIIHRTTNDLRESGILERAIQVGDRAPDFSLRDGSGEEISLKKLFSQGLVVLSFYRGKW
jgi:hypothetical protein